MKKIPNIFKGLPKVFAAIPVSSKYSSYPSNGLTPQRLTTILKEADSGYIERQAELFEEMEEKDPHLFSQLQTRKNAVTGLGWEIVSYSDDERDKQIAEAVRHELESFENIDDIFMDLLDAIGKGISVCEIIWCNSLSGTKIEDVCWIHPKNFFWDSEDCFKVRTKDNPEGIALPEDKFIIHKYKAKSGHPSRAGILRIVSWSYLFKNYDLKDWVTFCEIFAMPLRVGKYDPGASDSEKEALISALRTLGADAAGIIPNTADVTFHDSNKTASATVYERLARFCDEQISKAILGQTLTSDSGNGSYAQSKTHNEVRHDLTVADCKALSTTLRRDLIKPFVKYNFGETERIPFIKFNYEEPEDLKCTAEVYKTLVNDIGIDIPTNHIYEKFSIPKPEENEQTARGQKQEYLPIANKADFKNSQADIDELTEKAVEASDKIFDNMFQPLKAAIDSAESFEELKDIVLKDDKLSDIYKDMNDEALSKLIARVMLYADLAGRTNE